MITFDLEKLKAGPSPWKPKKDENGDYIPKLIVGGVVNGKAKYLAKPEYPVAARSKQVSGAVSVEVLIDERGKVLSSGAISGPGLLQAAAREAGCRRNSLRQLSKAIP